MNVSLNSLCAPPNRWYAEKNPGECIDPLKRWEAPAAPAVSKPETKFYVPEVKRSWTLKDAHYAAMEIQRKRNAAQFVAVPKIEAAISGYSGFIPYKEAGNVVGVTFKKANAIASQQLKH